ncbi:MAG: putative metal-binding motif-containing protein [Myxococcota bacterium]
MKLAWLVVAACSGGEDFDGDGWIEPGDCDDGDPGAHPGAIEIAYDGKDQDCDGADLDDRDGDGFQSQQAGGPDCDDDAPDVFPGAAEVAYDDVDQDCDDWNDDDFDHDGFEAMGHGGDDCDDFDATVIPLDLDGDGYSACTGDCDEGDPRRNEDAERVCGNGFDDDCDEVSDCTTVGVVDSGALALQLVGGVGGIEFGRSLAVPGDVDGDGAVDLVVTENLDAGGSVVRWYATPLVADGPIGVDAAAGSVVVPNGEVRVFEPGDVDGDGAPEVALGTGRALDASHLWFVEGIPDGSTIADVATLDLVGPGDADVGRSMVRIGDDVAVGAPGLSQVQLLRATTVGVRGFGEDGARLDGGDGENAGSAVDAFDADGDGALDLMITASGGAFGLGERMFRVSDPPSSGVYALDEIATGSLDLRGWGQTSTELAHGDLDGDGIADAAVCGPFAGGSVGAVTVLTRPLTGDAEVDDEPIQRLGLGDDTFGWSVSTDDFDGDGFADLIVGAPAAWGASGGADKPGAVHLWYGPIEQVVEHTFTADLLIEGAYTGHRTFTGYAMDVADVDGDGGVDLVIGSPNLELGAVAVLPGGLTGLYGW